MYWVQWNCLADHAEALDTMWEKYLWTEQLAESVDAWKAEEWRKTTNNGVTRAADSIK